MTPSKFSLQVTAYADGTFALAVVQQDWSRAGWRAEKPLLRANCTADEVEVQVLALLRQIVAKEAELSADWGRPGAKRPHTEPAAGGQ
jgi:hypothetical protein